MKLRHLEQDARRRRRPRRLRLSGSRGAAAQDDADRRRGVTGRRRRCRSAARSIVGVKYDQPGLGLKEPRRRSRLRRRGGQDRRQALGIDADEIEYKESASANREDVPRAGRRSSHGRHLLDHRRAQAEGRLRRPVLRRRPGAAGPRGRHRDHRSRNLKGKKVCSVTGSTPAQQIKDQQRQAGQTSSSSQTYSECVDQVPAARSTRSPRTRDPRRLRRPEPRQVQGRRQAFTEEKYGIGLKKDDTETPCKINDGDGADVDRRHAGRRPSRPSSASPAIDRPAERCSDTEQMRVQPPPGDARRCRRATQGAARRARGRPPTPRTRPTGGTRVNVLLDNLDLLAASGRSSSPCRRRRLDRVGTLLAAMRVGPVPVLRGIGTVYVNIVRNTPLTLIISSSRLGLVRRLGDLPDLTYQRLLAVAASACRSTRRRSSARRCARASTPCRSGRPRRPAPSGSPSASPEADRAAAGVPCGRSRRWAASLIALIKNTTIAAAIGLGEAALSMKHDVRDHGRGSADLPRVRAGLHDADSAHRPAFGWLAKRLAVIR